MTVKIDRKVMVGWVKGAQPWKAIAFQRTKDGLCEWDPDKGSKPSEGF